MKNNQSRFLELLNSFITEYLPFSYGASPNTVKSYKYTFILLFRFFETSGITPDKIEFSFLTMKSISDFLSWLETERKCSRSTRNQRHSKLLSFSKYAQNRNFEVASMFRSEILKIPMKKPHKSIVRIFHKKKLQLCLIFLI